MDEVKLLPCPFCGISMRASSCGRTTYHRANNCSLDGWHFNIPSWQARPTIGTNEVVERVIRQLRARSIPQAKAEDGIGWNCGLEEAEDVVRKALASMPTIDQDGGERRHDFWGAGEKDCPREIQLTRTRPARILPNRF